jgi:hypothetical protein
MVRKWATVLVTAVLAGCSSDGAITPAVEDGRVTQDNTSLSGTVVGFAWDSSLPPLEGVTVEVFLVDSLPLDPPDSTATPPPPPPPPPPDTGLLSLEIGPAQMDSLLPETPPDTVTPPPPDTAIPPPPDTLLPPATACGRAGRLLATLTTDEAGRFSTRGLPRGIYDIRATVEASDQYGTGLACGVRLVPGEATEIQIYAPARPEWLGW